MKAIVNVGTTAAAAASSTMAQLAGKRRRIVDTTPTTAATTNAGAVTGSDAARSTVSNVTPPITSARPFHDNHGANTRGVTVSGRRYCTSAVGRNLTPNKVSLLSAIAARRVAEKSFSTWRSNGTENGVPKRRALTSA